MRIVVLQMFHRLIKSGIGILVMAISGLISVLKLGDGGRVGVKFVGRIPRIDNAS